MSFCKSSGSNGSTVGKIAVEGYTSFAYTYDTCGNLLTKTIYPYTTGELGEDANVTEADDEEETIVEGEEEEISTENDEAVFDEGTDESVDEITGESAEEATEEKPEVSTEENQEETSEESSTESEVSEEEEVIPEGTEETEENEEASTVEEADSEVTTITYGYEDEVWKDKLTSYNGQTITYDGIGNPLSYRDGMHFSWQQGRQLASTTLADGTAISYQYNTDGIRISKTVAGVKTTYFVDASGTIHGLQQGDEILYFLYDSTGRREGFIHYSGSEKQDTYYYLYNAQSDVIGITNSNFEPVVSYEYDAWGKLLSVSGEKADTIGSLNPFRYRGYVYDEESGLYYLNSRYYDPETGRFVNADTIAVLSVSSGQYDKNLYAYCDNNPIVRKDSTGAVWETVFDVVSLGFSIAEVAANPYDVGAWIGLVGDAVDLIPFVTGVGETVRGIRFIDKAGNTLELARAVDFTDDAVDIARNLDRSTGFTKSTAGAGRKIHQGYKYGPEFSLRNKEYTGIKGARLDYYDGNTIFELKPHNMRSVKSGIKQLQRYNSLLGGRKIMRLELY